MKNFLLTLFVLAAWHVLADGPVVNPSPFGKKLIVAGDAGSARSLMGVSTTAANATNQSLWTPTLNGGTINGGTNNAGYDVGKTNINGTINAPTVNGGTINGGTNNAGYDVGKTNINGTFTGGNFAGSGDGLTNTAGTVPPANTNTLINAAQGTTISKSQATNVSTALVNNTFTLPKTFYVLSGMHDINNNIPGCNEVSFSFDARRVLPINNGASVNSGMATNAGTIYGTNTFTPTVMQFTNGLFYMASSPVHVFPTNIFIYVSASAAPGSWSYIYTLPILVPGVAQAYVGRWIQDSNGSNYLTFCVGTNGVNQDAFMVKVLDNTFTNYSAPMVIYSTNGLWLSAGAGVPGTVDYWATEWTGSNYIGLVSDIGEYGIVYVSTDLQSNWVAVGQIASTQGGLLKGEAFNPVLMPDGTTVIAYDDSPGDANSGNIRYIVSTSNAPPYGTLGTLGSIVFDNGAPIFQGEQSPFRFGSLTACSIITPAMLPLLSALIFPTNNPIAFAPPFYNGLNDGELVFYPFSEGQGTVITNYSPYGPNASFAGNANPASMWTNSAHLGSGLVLPLTNSPTTNYVVVNTQLATFDQNNFTVSMWFNQNCGTNAATQVFFSNDNGNSSFANGGSWGLEFGVSGGYGLIFYMHTSGGLNGTAYIPASWPATNKWHLVTVTYDGATNRIFLDGTLGAANNITGTMPILNGVFSVGAFPNGSLPFLGEVDDFRYWKRALSTNEILGLYQGMN